MFYLLDQSPFAIKAPVQVCQVGLPATSVRSCAIRCQSLWGFFPETGLLHSVLDQEDNA